MGRRKPWAGLTVELAAGEALRCEPVSAERFADLGRVLGDRGGPGGCWCMYWRVRNAEWRTGDPAQRKATFATRCSEPPPPGILGYLDGRPVGWCAIAPRAEYPRLQASPTFGPVDDTAAWAVSCLFVHRSARRRGVGAALVTAAVAMSRFHGATAVEGIPVAPGGSRPAGDLYTGTPSMFEPLGFAEVARRKPTRPIVRLTVA